MLRIVPLFESGRDARRRPGDDGDVLGAPSTVALAAVGDEQEMMIGYSDSNKDIGYVGSGLGNVPRPGELCEVMREAGCRGASSTGAAEPSGVAGPDERGDHGVPRGTAGGRVKLTEQGEVLATKYSVTEVAHRELELATSAVLALGAGAGAPATRADEEIMAAMAARSDRAYRSLVHEDPEFPAFLAAVTPLSEISRLRLGSRPRAAGRARDRRPAGHSVGVCLDAGPYRPSRLVRARDGARGRARRGRTRPPGEDGARVALLRGAAFERGDGACQSRRRNGWPLCGPVGPAGARERIWGRIEEELERTREELLLLRGGRRLVDGEPVLQASLDRRNPYVDPLSLIQVELLRRRGQAAGDDEALGRASLLTINGIAGGLRNTG